MTNDAMTKAQAKAELGETRGCGAVVLSLFIGNYWSLILVALVIGFSAVAASPGSATASRFGNLPLYFEANQGQTDARIQFFARGLSHTIYLGSEGATIALREDASAPRTGRVQPFQSTNNAAVRLVRMNLLGANPAPASTGQGRLPGRVNYLLGNDPAHWQPGVSTFAKVQYERVYPGIDLVYYGNEQELEYDFMVAAGADPAAIALRFDGADRLQIDERGDLVLHVGDTQLRQHKPVVYQIIGGVHHEVSGRYQMRDRQTVTFALGSYDRSQPLVIDPVLSYSTYLGGGKGDIGWAIAVDADGSAFIAGDTLSIFKSLPTSGQQGTNGGGTKYGGDAFVARLEFTTNLVTTNLSLGYLTYLGGNGLDGAIGIAVDAAGSAYITGYTTSSNFPAFPPSVFQPAIAGQIVGGFNSRYADAFVTKLDTNGLGVYSTYLGGELTETGVGIAVDAGGSAYVVGLTDSVLTFLITNQVATIRCTNGVCGGPKYVTNITTTPLIFSSAVVTNHIKTTVTATATNVIENVVTTTLLSSLTAPPVMTGFPLVNAVQTNNYSAALFAPGFKHGLLVAVTNVSSFSDLFITKLSPDGSTAVYSTYLGGELDDTGTGIAVDAAGNATISGYSQSSHFPTTNALQSASGGGRDAIVAKLDASGGLVYSTYLGGLANDSAYHVAVDASGAAYIAGATSSGDFPTTPGARNGGGLFLNADSASGDWTNRSSGLSHTVVQAFAADPNAAGTHYVGTPRGIFKSTDDGATWTAFSTGLVTRAINALLVDPFAPSTLYAGTPVGLFRSEDAGLNWTNHSNGLGSFDVRALLINPLTTNLYAGTARGIYERPLGATNWTLLGVGLQTRLVTAMAIHPVATSNFYAATSAGIFKSTNFGTNWKASNTGLKSTSIRSLALDPADASILYAGTAKGLHKSTNAAVNWSLRTNGIGRPAINALLIDPASPATLYAGTTNGLFKSVDSGENWIASQTNLTTQNVTTLAFAPSTATTLYAGTRGTGFAGGTNDAFLVKLAPDGQSFSYAFTFGGNRNDEAWGVAVDVNGCAFVTGQTASKNFPVHGPAGSFSSTNSWQTNLSGKIDAFVAQFDPTGSSNIFSIYFGGKKNDFGHGIALDAAGNAYIVGRTESTRLPTTNGLQSASKPVGFGGVRDAFVAKFITAPPPLSMQMVALASGGASPAPVTFDVVISWPAPAPEFTLEYREPSSSRWTRVTQSPVTVRGRHQVTLPASAANSFFRLRL